MTHNIEPTQLATPDNALQTRLDWCKRFLLSEALLVVKVDGFAFSGLGLQGARQDKQWHYGNVLGEHFVYSDMQSGEIAYQRVYQEILMQDGNGHVELYARGDAGAALMSDMRKKLWVAYQKGRLTGDMKRMYHFLFDLENPIPDYLVIPGRKNYRRLSL